MEMCKAWIIYTMIKWTTNNLLFLLLFSTLDNIVTVN